MTTGVVLSVLTEGEEQRKGKLCLGTCLEDEDDGQVDSHDVGCLKCTVVEQRRDGGHHRQGGQQVGA
eukprot:scaffold6790_cov99-Isochrysis_galbana.AAC.5